MATGVKKNTQPDGTFHGGFVRDRGGGLGVRVARSKNSDIPKIDGDDAAVRQAELSANKRPGSYPNGPSPVKARRTKLAVLGIPSSILDKGSQEYARCVRMAQSYKKARSKELYIAHGYVSSGASALLAAASLALSASRFLYEIAANSPIVAERGGISMPQILKLASSLSDSARQNELSAWELCAREAQIKKRNEQNTQALPWLVETNPQPTGEVKRPRGRPRKVELLPSVSEVEPCQTITVTAENVEENSSTELLNG